MDSVWGFEKLATVLIPNTSITTLKFHPDEYLGTRSAKHIAAIITHNTALKSIVLHTQSRQCIDTLTILARALLFQPVRDRRLSVGARASQAYGNAMVIMNAAANFGPPNFQPQQFRPPEWSLPLGPKNSCLEHPAIRDFWRVLFLCANRIGAQARPGTGSIPLIPLEIWDLIVSYLSGLDVVPYEYCTLCHQRWRKSTMVHCRCKQVWWCSSRCRGSYEQCRLDPPTGDGARPNGGLSPWQCCTDSFQQWVQLML